MGAFSIATNEDSLDIIKSIISPKGKDKKLTDIKQDSESDGIQVLNPAAEVQPQQAAAAAVVRKPEIDGSTGSSREVGDSSPHDDQTQDNGMDEKSDTKDDNAQDLSRNKASFYRQAISRIKNFTANIQG